MNPQEFEFLNLPGREDALCSFDKLCADAREGSGTGLLIRGAAGDGKTTFLRAVTSRAQSAGMLVVEAKAHRLETNCQLGVVRQLFDDVKGFPPASRVHELYENAMALTVNQPTVIAVDDLQWVDEASRRWLAYLLHRIRHRRTLVVATTSQPTNTTDLDLADRFTHLIPLAQLHPHDIVDLGEIMKTPIGSELATLCHQATDGHPLLTLSLIRAMRASHRPADATALNDVLASPPAEILTWLRRTLSAYAPNASDLIAAIAVHRAPVEPDLAAATAEPTTEPAGQLVDKLAAAGLLRWHNDQISLRSPLLQLAVLADLSPGAARVLRAKAARVLHTRGAPDHDVASQLLQAEPLGEPWAADVLDTVAAKAAEEGDADRTLSCLRAALREPMTCARRAELMVRAASVKPPAEARSAIHDLRRALEITSDIAVRASAARRLATLLNLSGNSRQARQILRNVAEPALGHSTDIAASLALEEVLLAAMELPTPDQATIRTIKDCSDRAHTLKHETPGILWSLHATVSGRHRRQAAQQSSQLLDYEPAPVTEVSLQPSLQVWTLLTAGEFHLALHHANNLINQTTHRADSALQRAYAHAIRSEVNYQRGRLQACQDDAAACLQTFAPFTSHQVHGLALVATARLVDTMVDRDDLNGAERLIKATLKERPVPANPPGAWLLTSRGRLRRARGRNRAAAEDFLKAGKQLKAWRIVNPAVLPWRSLASVSYAAIGMHRPASELVNKELILAREWGSAPAIGMALRAAGKVAKGNASIRLLREAVAVLASCGALLELARAQADLGIALRSANRLVEARQHLRQATASAQQLGAHALVRHARAELTATGAPLRDRTSGIGSLTPTERRVASMAAGGLSNRQIAERLFVVQRTVEIHLTNTYRKLGIQGREDLAEAIHNDGSK